MLPEEQKIKGVITIYIYIYIIKKPDVTIIQSNINILIKK